MPIIIITVYYIFDTHTVANEVGFVVGGSGGCRCDGGVPRCFCLPFVTKKKVEIDRERETKIHALLIQEAAAFNSMLFFCPAFFLQFVCLARAPSHPK